MIKNKLSGADKYVYDGFLEFLKIIILSLIFSIIFFPIFFSLSRFFSILSML